MSFLRGAFERGNGTSRKRTHVLLPLPAFFFFLPIPLSRCEIITLHSSFFLSVFNILFTVAHLFSFRKFAICINFFIFVSFFLVRLLHFYLESLLGLNSIPFFLGLGTNCFLYIFLIRKGMMEVKIHLWNFLTFISINYF